MIPIVIASAVKDGMILLIKRRKGHFPGLWGLPGGKLEFGEHINQGMLRELKEATSLDAGFRGLTGVVSEHIMKDGEVDDHFILFLCNVDCQGQEREMRHGEVKWFSLDEFERMKDIMIPRDFHIVENIVKQKKGGVFVSTIEKQGDSYTLKDFREM